MPTVKVRMGERRKPRALCLPPAKGASTRLAFSFFPLDIKDAVFSQTDTAMMRRALLLAQKAGSATSPNPMVGAVLAFGDRILAEGAHLRAGEPHAEVNCLRQLNPAETGDATLFVTLEPCSHTGKTPPCADLIVQYGPRRVVVAVTDPNPLVAGRGIARLREAGIQVDVGLLELEARRLNAPFFSTIEKSRPFVLLKWAESRDGALAEAPGVRTTISGSESRNAVLKLRAWLPAILVGSETALVDQPRLGLDGHAGHCPVRVVLDGRLRLAGRKSLKAAADRPLLYSGRQDDQDLAAAASVQGFDCVLHDGQRHWPLKELLDDLQGRGLNGLLVEGGAQVLDSFLKEALVDEVVQIVSPIRLPHGVPAPTDGQLLKAGLVQRATHWYGRDMWRIWRRQEDACLQA
jgi:diaminohydroxyphosphoribosylaminopyrimidine deaminase/5-amino-6-(5-phosphoribosylamino)uracil reductase